MMLDISDHYIHMNGGRQSIFKIKSNQVKILDLFFSAKSGFDLMLAALNIRDCSQTTFTRVPFLSTFILEKICSF